MVRPHIQIIWEYCEDSPHTSVLQSIFCWVSLAFYEDVIRSDADNNFQRLKFKLSYKEHTTSTFHIDCLHYNHAQIAKLIIIMILSYSAKSPFGQVCAYHIELTTCRYGTPCEVAKPKPSTKKSVVFAFMHYQHVDATAALKAIFLIARAVVCRHRNRP